MTKESAIEYFHNLRRTVQFKKTKDVFGSWDWRPRGDDMFLFDCLSALHTLSDEGVAEFLTILENSQCFTDAAKCVKNYNSPRHPIRNFLIRCYIDYPIEDKN